MKDNNFTVVEHILVESDNEEEIEIAIKKWTPEGFAYPVDGIVAEYNDIE